MTSQPIPLWLVSRCNQTKTTSTAEGVGKTFARRYRENPALALELEIDGAKADNSVKYLSAKIVKESHITPFLEGDGDYLMLEKRLFPNFVFQDAPFNPPWLGPCRTAAHRAVKAVC